MNESGDGSSLLRRPAVIVGVGRSGTSLLQSMLHAHPSIVVLPETHFFRKYVGPPLARLRVAVQGPLKLRSRLARDREFARAGISARRLLSSYVDERSATFSAAAVHRSLLEAFVEQCISDGGGASPAVVGIKDPRLIDFLPTLHRYYPHARVLHIIRDPRDVLLSRRNADWSAGRPDWSHALIYHLQMAQCRKLAPRLFGDGYVEVLYEDLLDCPAGVLETVCGVLGVDFTEEMLSFGEAASELVSEEELQWKSETMEGLLRNNAGKWRRGLSEQTAVLAERMCIEPFPDLPYQRQFTGPRTFRERLVLSALTASARTLQAVYRLRALKG